MALTIPDYTYIAHKLINRPWGPEVRFTVARSDGSHINEVIPINHFYLIRSNSICFTISDI